MKTFLTSFLLFFSFYATAVEVTLSASIHNEQSWDYHTDYFTLNLPYSPVKKVLGQITKTTGPLKSRGEAHITVLTPPEYAASFAKAKISINSMKNIIENYAVSFQVLGLGKGLASGMENYFLIVSSPDLIQIRHELADLLPNELKANFSPEHFYPHITVGFTDRDLHEADGVIKDLLHSKDPRFDLIEN